jgi:hypothetical protein
MLIAFVPAGCASAGWGFGRWRAVCKLNSHQEMTDIIGSMNRLVFSPVGRTVWVK